ncbi:hypothetical protein D1007_23496 [Hordeum vulgare]|uniref:Uncharacterized protein n=1 Tax=Hordeum vulgare subsp. vulgare TaxID=112509 RepID=A0A8I6W8G9_HORVV|nr:uncharacterized protein LOC123420348 [Hordeum vulgare subsp. vulgare]KAE8800990.1 hypothetical protein D1007_23496 [Hordeum vulgare]KAI5020488.1 hypothetical protein ZWY2020_045376 [Hordeum vulgare]
MPTISCCHQLKPPSPTLHLQPAGGAQAPAHLPALRRACFAAAACVVAVGAMGAVDGAAMARGPVDDGAAHGAALVHVQAPARWSDRRQCPPWHANSLENVVPENLPRPSARRRYNGVAAADKGRAPAPDAVLPFLVLRSGSGMGCFSL